jgi:hypothetical protein
MLGVVMLSFVDQHPELNDDQVRMITERVMTVMGEGDTIRAAQIWEIVDRVRNPTPIESYPESPRN